MLTALAMLPLGTMVTRLSPVMTISSSSESDSEIIRLEVCASDGRGHKLKPFSNKIIKVYALLNSKSGSSCPSLVYLVLRDLAPPLDVADDFPLDIEAFMATSLLVLFLKEK